MIKSKHVHLSNDGLSYSVTADEEWRLSAEQVGALETIRYVNAVLNVAKDPHLLRRVCEPRSYNLINESVYYVKFPFDILPEKLVEEFKKAPAIELGSVSVKGVIIADEAAFAHQELAKMVELVEPAYLRYLHRRGQLTPSGKKHLMNDDFSL
ncbi:hypothetical protein P5704_024910 (plasmid) [Pseudomonas sp. FeN3W]|nr:hypothetical protein P5704_024910 [Pseudomonas sp. FeN3W]